MNQHVADTICELERFMAGVDDAMPIPREAGQFVHALILASGAKHGLEIGTSYGYSALWIASALAENGGRLITIDHDLRKSQAARKALEEAGLASYVDLRTGTAVEVLGSLDVSFDFVLNDADKANCIRYVDRVAGKLIARAVVLTDNTVTHPDELAGFVKWVRANSDFYSAGVPVGNGMEMSVKRAVP